MDKHCHATEPHCSKNKNCCTVAKVRKPAPEFTAMAWWNGFKKVSLSDFKGKQKKHLS